MALALGKCMKKLINFTEKEKVFRPRIYSPTKFQGTLKGTWGQLFPL